MNGTLVDSNVILDIFTQDPTWSAWATAELERCANDGVLFINPIIYAEVSIRFNTVEELEAVLPPDSFRRLSLPCEVAFLAGKAFLRYRRQGGQRRSTLPDFFIGAHAAIASLRLLTRDAARYRTYFPTVSVIAPD